jgi:hypothetical protein
MLASRNSSNVHLEKIHKAAKKNISHWSHFPSPRRADLLCIFTHAPTARGSTPWRPALHLATMNHRASGPSTSAHHTTGSRQRETQEETQALRVTSRNLIPRGPPTLGFRVYGRRLDPEPPNPELRTLSPERYTQRLLRNLAVSHPPPQRRGWRRTTPARGSSASCASRR